MHIERESISEEANESQILNRIVYDGILNDVIP